MNELFSICDDHFKIFIIIWLKLRDFYLESKNKGISIPFVVKKTLNFLKKIRKQCTKIKRFRKIAKFVYFLEIELVESDKFIDKLQHFAILAEIFDLPEPIKDILKNIGLNAEEDFENNLFSKKINDLFKNIDDIDLEKKVNIIDDTIQEEGTLVNFLKNKRQDDVVIKKIIPEPVTVYKPPIELNNIYNLKSTNISRIPRIGATPNQRTIYRHH
jgi:GTPase SAR1 family protein